MEITERILPVIGAICGDIIGSAFEGDYVKDYDFQLFTRYSVFTDDTVCTFAVADALGKGKPFDRTLQEWCRRYPRAGYGGTFRRWIMMEDPKPYNSWGNGSAMRVSAVCSFADNLEDVIKLATASAEVTHNHPEGIKGAVATACAIFLAKEGKTKDEIRSYIEDNFGYDLGRKYANIQPGYRFDVSCQGSVPESIICFLEGESYEDTIRKAVAMGGDTDTMAAIAGGIAAAYYGEIPDEIVEECEKRLPLEMLEVLNHLKNKN